MRLTRVRLGAAIVPVLMAVAACADAPTSTKPTDVRAMQARWQARGFTKYHYDFDQGGFFNNCPRPVRVYVTAGAVDSAVVIATGGQLAAPLVQYCAPTIDGMFSGALNASASGTLARIRYDARYGYPTQMTISGPPDAGGFLAASAFAPE